MAIPLSRVGRDILEFIGVMLGIWAAVDVGRLIVRAIRGAPSDRVLRLEVLAFASFWLAVAVAAVYFHFHHALGPLDFLWLISLFAPFVIFTGLAGYVAISNWARRKREAS